MPKLRKTAGNLVSTRLAIPDEYVAACGWDSDEFVDIERYRDPQDNEYCLIIRRLSFKDDQLLEIHAQSRAMADVKKLEREAAAAKDKKSK